MSSVLEAIRLRTLREVFAYLRDTADRRQDERLLAGLPVPSTGSVLPESIPTMQPTPPRQRKSTRKAPLDTSRPSCICVYVFQA
jgi:hypothetical protein